MDPAALRQAFGDVVRELRAERGLSQEGLSFLCERHRTYVSLIERGHNSPTIQTVWDLANALEVQPEELISLTSKELVAAQRRGRRKK